LENFYPYCGLTPRFTRARRAYALRLTESGAVNLNKNLACGVGCKRLLARPFSNDICYDHS